MPRNITVYFSDGMAHQYNNAPDDFTPDQVEARTKKDYPNKKIVKIDGGKKTSNWDLPKNEEIKYQKFIDQAKESVKDDLLDDSSARFKKVFVTSNEQVWGLINAKNRSGGYVGWKAFDYNINTRQKSMSDTGRVGELINAMQVDNINYMWENGKSPNDKINFTVIYRDKN